MVGHGVPESGPPFTHSDSQFCICNETYKCDGLYIYVFATVNITAVFCPG